MLWEIVKFCTSFWSVPVTFWLVRGQTYYIPWRCNYIIEKIKRHYFLSYCIRICSLNSPNVLRIKQCNAKFHPCGVSFFSPWKRKGVPACTWGHWTKLKVTRVHCSEDICASMCWLASSSDNFSFSSESSFSALAFWILSGTFSL